MSESEQRLWSFDVDFYQHSQSNVLRLKNQLPKDALDGIVLEVLHRVKTRPHATGDTVDAPSQAKVERLSYALISDDPSEGAHLIEDARAEGASLEAIYLNYLAPAARTLGIWWEDDHATFAEVMIGSSRIYSILRSLSYLFVPDHPVEVRSAVFAAVPEETHTLGIRMAADLLGKRGWDISLLTGLAHDPLVDAIVATRTPIVGLSAAGRHAAAPLTRLIVALRIACPSAAILLSGQITRAAPDIVALMDVDGIAEDIDSADELMARLWKKNSRKM